MFLSSAKTWQWFFGALLGIAGIVMIGLLTRWSLSISQPHSPERLWLAGAAALGLLTGFATGLSGESGSGKQFVAFVGTGILVPILGGVGAVLVRSERVTEKSTYAGNQLVEKTTETIPAEGSLDPMAVVGSFFVLFALFGALGLIGGALLKKAGVIQIMAV